MDKVQPDREIYVPKGRRLLIETASSVSSTTRSKKRSISEETAMDQSNSKSNSRLTGSTSTEIHAPMENNQRQNINKTNVVPRSNAVYVPPGRRGKIEETKPPSTSTELKTVFKVPDRKQSASPPTHEDSTFSNIVDAVSVPISKLGISQASTAGIGTKPREAPRGIYVPRGRRDLIEKATTEPVALPSTHEASQSNTSASSSGVVASQEDGETGSTRVKVKLTPYTKWEDSSDDDTPTKVEAIVSNPSQEEIIGEACLLLTGLPSEMSEAARGNIVHSFIEKGATPRWLGFSDCVLAFKSDRIATGALPPMGTSIFRVIKLKDAPLPARGIYIDAVKDLFAVTKPERDSTVANRLIGAALGIRLPAPAKTAAAEARAKAKPRAPSPPREDAWDD